MRAVLLAGGIAMAITLLATPAFIWLFKRLNWGQFIRADGPKSHYTKHGTPTMGGVVIFMAQLRSRRNHHSPATLTSEIQSPAAASARPSPPECRPHASQRGGG
jgi:hypothetical protein